MKEINSVANGYFGIPFDFKLTSLINGHVRLIGYNKGDIYTMSLLDLSQFKVQQFTGILDKHGAKIYFGDTLRFADKFEWYRNSYFSKVVHGIMTKQQVLDEIEQQPYEERLVESNGDFEWLLSTEIQTYWEIVC